MFIVPSFVLFAALSPVTGFGSNPGALDMFEYVPADLPSGRPLVVVMHGCTQTASAMETAGWNVLADKYQFAVLYPQQRSANQQLSCFTWYAPGDTARGAGEAESIMQMIDTSIAKHGVSKDRVYVTGLSAGGAFTAVMLAAYPDRFRAGSIMSGVPVGCATDVSSGQSCASSGATKTPEQWGDAVRAAYRDFHGAFPRVQIWQGSMDYTVKPSNATELVKQWTNVWGIDEAADVSDTISNATRTQYEAGSQVVVELYLVNGMGHAIATGADDMGACPATSGAFFADEKICSTLRAAQFFGLLGGGDSDGDGPNGDANGDGPAGGASDDDGGCNAGGGSGFAIAMLVLAQLATWKRRAV